MPIAAGIMTAVNSRNEPVFGEVLEVILTFAVANAIRSGLSVHNSPVILDIKKKVITWAKQMRDEGNSPSAIIDAAKLSPWDFSK